MLGKYKTIKNMERDYCYLQMVKVMMVTLSMDASKDLVFLKMS